jgi:hypothetical protein
MKKTMTALRLGAGLGLALAALSSPALAQQAAGTADNLTVVRDPQTGQLRAPTAAELATLQAAGPRVRSLHAPVVQRPLAKFHHSGAHGARMTDAFATAEVVVRKPDGTLESQCVDIHAADSTTATQHPLAPVTE